MKILLYIAIAAFPIFISFAKDGTQIANFLKNHAGYASTSVKQSDKLATSAYEYENTDSISTILVRDDKIIAYRITIKLRDLDPTDVMEPARSALEGIFPPERFEITSMSGSTVGDVFNLTAQIVDTSAYAEAAKDANEVTKERISKIVDSLKFEMQP